MIPANLVTLGVAFYDSLRGHGANDFDARHVAVCYMRRKDPDGHRDPMPYYEALADSLAQRAGVRHAAALAAWREAAQGCA